MSERKALDAQIASRTALPTGFGCNKLIASLSAIDSYLANECGDPSSNLEDLCVSLGITPVKVYVPPVKAVSINNILGVKPKAKPAPVISSNILGITPPGLLIL